jgi:transposase
MVIAGIDVGAKTLIVAIDQNGKTAKPQTFENTPPAHRRLLQTLRRAKVERVILEATGTYHFDLAIALHEAEGLEVMVVNPKISKRYAEVRMSRTKTDEVDAALLCDFGRHMPFEPWRCPSRKILALRACSRLLASLAHQRTQAKNRLHAFAQTRSTPDFVLAEIRRGIEQIEIQIQHLESQTLELIQEDALLSAIYAHLLSVKGIATKSAIQLMGELLVLPQDMAAKQWVAMAGLDPREHRSGSSVEKKTRISKVGNRYLRMALYMPALAATRHEPHVRAYYRHLIEDRGLKKIQAICAVMRKLLHAIHGMLRHDADFDGTRFYHGPLPDSSSL